jgi:seryl-tRNA synthetase
LFERTDFFLLSFSIPDLAEKEELTLQHSHDLEAQRNEAAKLKDQLIKAGLQHVRELKEAIAASDAKVEEARKEFAEATEQLRALLEEETRLLHLEQDQNAELVASFA